MTFPEVMTGIGGFFFESKALEVWNPKLLAMDQKVAETKAVHRSTQRRNSIVGTR